ncbi:MAG: fibronectin type III domain-containing protein, partial [Elusimicrobiota bacterium]|nr:fibronectin type III domain-containing protein [Elusimicrobiota bacterium]
MELHWADGSDDKTASGGLQYSVCLTTTQGETTIQSGIYGTPFLGKYLLYNTTTTNFNRAIFDISLFENLTFYWKIATVDAGLKQSNWSAEQTYFWYGIPPAAITTLSVNRIDDGIASLSWIVPGDNQYEGDIISGKYHIKYTAQHTDTWDSAPYEILKATDMLSGSKQTYTITELNLPTTYYFWLKIADEVLLWSEMSNKTTAFLVVPPAPVTDLVSNRLDDTIVSLVWTATGDDGYTGDITGGKYHIKYTTNPTDSWEIAPYEIISSTDIIQNSKQTVNITGLTIPTTYYFWIKASDEVSNWSDVSNKVTAYLAIAPSAITNLSVDFTHKEDKELKLNWTVTGDDQNIGDIIAGSFWIKYSTESTHDWNNSPYEILKS